MLSCQVEIPESSKLTFANTPATEALTVGSEFVLTCKGEWPENFYPENAAKPIFALTPEEVGSIQLLDFQFVDKESAKITVTSYKAGLHQFKSINLKSGEQTLDLGPLEWTVASVIDPQKPPENPYGPVGPFKLMIPMAYWVILFAIFFILFFTLGSKIYRRSQRKKLMADPRLQDSAQSPSSQFYQALRKIQRQFAFFAGQKVEEGEVALVINQVQEAYQIYISRVFNVPALRWNAVLVVNDIKKKEILSDELLQKLKKNLSELDRASLSKVKTSEKDCAQLIDLVRVHVDQIESLQEGSK